MDRTWDVVTLWLMTIVEMNVGLIAACMPAVATVVRAHNPQIVKFWTLFTSKIPSISVKVSVRRRSRGSSEGYSKESKDQSRGGSRGTGESSGKESTRGRGNGGQGVVEQPKPAFVPYEDRVRVVQKRPQFVEREIRDTRDGGEEMGPNSPSIHILS